MDPTRGCVPALSWEGGCLLASVFRSWQCLELDTDAVLCDNDIPFNMNIAHPKQWGIYVCQYNRNVSIRNTVIDYTYGGIYLPAGSSYSNMSGLAITNTQEREAIAIDSSHHNINETDSN